MQIHRAVENAMLSLTRPAAVAKYTVFWIFLTRENLDWVAVWAF